MADGLHARLGEVEQTPLKVLFVRIGAMGDVLHGLPAAAALRERLPHCRIGWAVEPKWAPLLVDADRKGPIVDRVHLVPTLEWRQRPFAFETVRDVFRLRSELRAEHYDLCIDLQGAIKSAVVGRMAAAKAFIGLSEPREPQARMLYSRPVDVHSPHVVEQACELVQRALATLAPERLEASQLAPAKVALPVDPEAERWCNRTLRDFDIRSDDFVLFAPHAGWGAKQWQPERYATLARHLAHAGHRVIVNAGTGAERATTAQITSAGDAVKVTSNVAQLVALTRRARLVVGGDTGPVHLAAALGKPVVALYGPTDPARNGPYFAGARLRVIRSLTSQLDHARHPQIEAGLATVTEDEVLAAALSLLNPQQSEQTEDVGTDPVLQSAIETAVFLTDPLLWNSVAKHEQTTSKDKKTKQADSDG